MRGPIGSEIEITIRRIGKKKSFVYKIKREVIEIKSVKAKYLDEEIGYLLSLIHI